MAEDRSGTSGLGHRIRAAADENFDASDSAASPAIPPELNSSDPDPEAAIRLSELAAALGHRYHGADVEVTGIAVDSRQVRPGDLFVAQRGEQTDGLRFVPEARGRGAVAACSAAPLPDFPTIIATDPRGAVPHLAATLYGHPASRLRLVGITGTLGKTSTALLVQSALAASGVRVGVIGSLGVRHRGQVADTGMTTPDAPSIHRALREMVDAGVSTAVMEVTSHGIALKRVAGLTFALGALTNLVPDEHLDFHGTPEHYLRTKARFFDMLGPGAPMVVSRDDAHVRNLVAAAGLARVRPVIEVSAEGDPEAEVAVSGLRCDAAGSVFALEIRRPLPRADGTELAPTAIPLVLPVLGVHQVANAALAAVVALLAGGAPAGVTESVAELAPIRRRMEVVRQASPTILDDTVGNPRSVDSVFATIRSIPHRSLRIAFGIRGARGPAINRRLAAALARAVRSAQSPVQLVVTASDDSAGARDRVRDEEREAAVSVLREEGVGFSYEPDLEAAVRRALEGSGEGDLVLLLGAQGMDGAADIARALLASMSP
jgi:UDP-N-acetylmuramoyl-L-alanyl-D-glutamate--2,6-diaminopimelate ligase